MSWVTNVILIFSLEEIFDEMLKLQEILNEKKKMGKVFDENFKENLKKMAISPVVIRVCSKSLLVGVGDRRQDKWYRSEEVGVRIVSIFLCPTLAVNTNFLSVLD